MNTITLSSKKSPEPSTTDLPARAWFISFWRSPDHSPRSEKSSSTEVASQHSRGNHFLLRGKEAFFYLLVLLITSRAATGASPSTTPAEEKLVRWRLEMVEKDLRARGIRDERVLQAMSRIPRHRFVDERLNSLAYADGPQPIGAGQTISQPYVVALMTEILQLTGSEKVLEIGTGSGYQAAVLSYLAREVYTIEIIPALAVRAKQTLTRLGYQNVWARIGDGFFGWEEKGPFDAVLITAAADKTPQHLWAQLREGGRLVMPLGNPRATQTLVRVTKIRGEPRVENFTGVLFVPMTGAVQESFR
jgi:protein-L-isoaspartate(D-aspartate) O-methyltransferase